MRNYVQYTSGTQLNNDPFVSIYPNISNPKYGNNDQEKLIFSGFAQFIPICTAKDFTSYQYSVSITNSDTTFDIYFVPSEQEVKNFLIDPTSLKFYSDDGCHVKNFQSFTGVCKNIGKNRGLLIVIPDNLSLSLTKVSVSLHEQSMDLITNPT